MERFSICLIFLDSSEIEKWAILDVFFFLLFARIDQSIDKQFLGRAKKHFLASTKNVEKNCSHVKIVEQPKDRQTNTCK